jgi:hypothetical protein
MPQDAEIMQKAIEDDYKKERDYSHKPLCITIKDKKYHINNSAYKGYLESLDSVNILEINKWKK